MKSIYTLIGICLLAASCSESYETITTESGIVITCFERGTDTLQSEKILMIQASYVMADGDTLISSTPDMPLAMYYDNSTATQSGLIKEVVDLLKVGDSVYFELPAKDLWEVSFRSMLPDSVGKDEIVKVNFRLTQQLTQPEYQQYMMALEEKMFMESYATEEAALDLFIQSNNISAQKTESGLYYVMKEEGTGEFPQTNDKVNVKYEGTLLTGEAFDAGTYAFPLGQGQVIPGWDEGIALLKKGGKATLYIPSKLAYRNRAAGPVIAPFSSLKFEVELLEIN